MGDLPATFSDQPQSRDVNEAQKFDLDDEGFVIVRTSAKGAYTQSGLKTEGIDTETDVSDSAWTILPASPLTGRNSIAIQNQSDVECKVTFVGGSTGGYIGWVIEAGGFYTTDITDAIAIYGRAASGSGKTLLVRELK